MNTLKKDWKSTYGIGHILVTVKCLLIYPNPESALDEEAGKLLLEEYSSYCERAKLITSIHATPRVKPVEFNTPSPAESSSKDTAEASTSKVAATTTSSPSTPSATSIKTSPPLPVPVLTRKSASPAPMSLKASLTVDKEQNLTVGHQKERHISPSPLGTADANVDNGSNGKPGMGVGMGMASAAAGIGGVPGTKAVKRSATGSAPTNAEKRKKALKRL